MKNSAAFDLHTGRFIHLPWPLIVFSAFFFSCSENKHPSARHAADGNVQAADAQAPQDQTTNPDATGLPIMDKSSEKGFFRIDGGDDGLDKTVALEVGSTPKGLDISLSRQVAASRARANLLSLLKSKGLAGSVTTFIRGVTIERYWIKNNKVFALARFELQDQNIPKDLNVRGPTPSNASEDTGKNTATPKGGAEK